MDHTSVEDFQDYHNPNSAADNLSQQCDSLHDLETVAQSFDEDQEPEASLSGSGHHSSDPDEMVFDFPSGHSSPCTSHHSDDDISVLLSGSRQPSYNDTSKQHPSSPYTPDKMRSPFRNPSSVRAMQMDTTPPPYLTTPSSQQRHKLTTSSRNGTPRSTRSHHSAMRSQSKLSPSKKSKKEYPLVLLHVTLLPIPMFYSTEVLESVLPGHILENWKLLQEKATDTVLERGILIPHPREDYDLLEERLLESLELKLPRILKCGHFHLEPDEEADALDPSDVEDFDDEDNDVDICDDCGRRVRDGRFGSGTGSRRWDIKLFAANGLMRAGAWGAAWREMERVDVEIVPWMGEDMKRELELRKEDEERHAVRVSQETAAMGNGINLDDARMREIYGNDAQAYVDGLNDEKAPPPSPPSPSNHHHHQRTRAQEHDIPLWTLFRNYITIVSRDQRTLAIIFLSVLVIFLSLRSLSPSPLPPPNQITPSPTAFRDAAESYADDASSRGSVSVTSASASTSTVSSPVSADSASVSVPEPKTMAIPILAAADEEILFEF